MGDNTKRVKTQKRPWRSSQENREYRLGKRLTYLLRYGALKEGLEVTDAGYVALNALLQAPHIRGFSVDEVLLVLRNSRANAGVRKFEIKGDNGQTRVRASYGRRMERDPCHENSNVQRLLEICVNQVCSNLEQYDLTDFQDEYIINCMIDKLRRSQRLNNKTWRALLVPCVERLDLRAVYLTDHTLRLLAEGCPNLRTLNMRQCAYIATDHNMHNLLKKLAKLESINLSSCHHLSDVTVSALHTYCPRLSHVNLAHAPLISEQAILNLITHCDQLEYLNITGNRNITTEGRVVLEEFSEQRNMTIVLKEGETNDDKIVERIHSDE